MPIYFCAISDNHERELSYAVGCNAALCLERIEASIVLIVNKYVQVVITHNLKNSRH